MATPGVREKVIQFGIVLVTVALGLYAAGVIADDYQRGPNSEFDLSGLPSLFAIGLAAAHFAVLALAGLLLWVFGKKSWGRAVLLACLISLPIVVTSIGGAAFLSHTRSARESDRRNRETEARNLAAQTRERQGPHGATLPAPTAACPESGEGVSMSADSILSGPVAFDLYAGTVAPESLATVDAVARRLRACATVKLEIQVHTDAFRASSFNARASQRVAEAVRDRLVAGGVDAARLVPCGYGESRPITSAPGIQPRAVNARVEWRQLADSAATFTCPAVQE